MKKLYHFSEDPQIDRFVPRRVQVPSQRAPGREWLNGPLVWAIDEDHQRMYLFPRECPRILLWAKPQTTPEDRQRWLGDLAPGKSAIAYVEQDWLAAFSVAVIYRYELPGAGFLDLQDAGAWVSQEASVPRAMTTITDLGAALERCATELRVVDSLAPLRNVWNSTVHASGIRLRNATGFV